MLLQKALMEQRVAVMKDNLSFVLRVDGDFLEYLELRDFPFDMQPLTLKMSVKCANEHLFAAPWASAAPASPATPP